MKDILKIIIYSIIGGIITLSGYLFFIEKPNDVYTANQPQDSFAVPINNGLNSINYNDIESINLTEAAEKSVNSVVHITNTSTFIKPTSMFDLYNRKGVKQQIGIRDAAITISDDQSYKA